MNEDMKSFYAAIILSALVVFGINYFFPSPKQLAAEQNVQTIAAPADDIKTEVADNAAVEEAPVEPLSKEEILQQDARIAVENASLEGSIRLKGARFDNILLSKYKQSIADDSPLVALFNPAKTDDAYFAEFGWLSGDKSIKLPASDTVWQVVGNDKLTPQTPVTLVWDNGEGLKFINQISLDENYLFKVKQSVENESGRQVTLIPYGLFSKSVAEDKLNRSVVHEGFTGVLDNHLEEIKYAKISEHPEEMQTTGGWVSFSDKYWFGAFVFNEKTQNTVNLRKVKDGVFQLDYKGLPVQIQSGSTAGVSSRLYAGAKEIKLLDKYSKDIKKFDLNVDFGWYYFITKPFFYILDFFYGFLGNMGWAIILFAALLRLFMFPIANKSYESMSKMKKIQPKIMVLQEIYKDDKLALQRATMELYKKEKVNPASGCLPLFIQIPIFFSLYKVLNIAIEIRHAPFIGWVKDLSAPDPLTISTWAHIYVPSMIDIGVWPLIYGLTMFLQNKLNPQPANKDQARMFALMPIIFMLMFAHFAVGLVIYWTLSNVLSLLQQKLIMYKNGVK